MIGWNELSQDKQEEVCKYLEENQSGLVSRIYDIMDKFYDERNNYCEVEDDEVEEPQTFRELLDDYNELIQPIWLYDNVLSIDGHRYDIIGEWIK